MQNIDPNQQDKSEDKPEISESQLGLEDSDSDSKNQATQTDITQSNFPFLYPSVI
jgi:hypothetical protein